ncbi:alpha/beta hydrolase [Saccharothrix algeriensis]|nr:alpha/beta hydrolase [Saccharothrix algeriensis]
MVPRLLRDSGWRHRTPDEGGGLGVLLVPGFGFGDRSLVLASAWLRARGYRPAPARIGLNVGCTSELVDRIERRLEEHVERTGRRVVVLGQSRGGWLGRLAAARRPDLVRGLVTLGSPVLDPLGVSPRVVRAARALTRLSALGVPGLLDEDCFTGPCYHTNTASLAAELPPSVPALAFASRLDRVAPWELCQDPSAECVEIRSSHTAMGLHPDFYRILRPKLAAWAAADDLAPSPV